VCTVRLTSIDHPQIGGAYPNFEEEELFQEFRQKSFSPKQMPWEPSKIKDFH
jgi:hypothetical protein